MKRFIISVILIAGLQTLSQTNEIELSSKWELRQKGTEKWYPAIVPGTVHTDLLANKLIPDPYFSDNEKKVQWIENEDWEYRTQFFCDERIFAQKNVELKFEGLDTYAKVYLNNKLILDANNMFRSWTVNVKKEILKGNNLLLIVFESAVKKGKAEAAKLSYTLPGNEKVFTRKAQYQYGWDWGPRLVTCGIFKPVKLIGWNKLKITSVYAYTKELKDSTAKMEFVVETTCDTEEYYEIKYRYTGRKGEQSKLESKLVILKPGINTSTINLDIPKPQLWWCNGLNKGRAALYSAGFRISKDDSIIDQKNVTFGIRTLELIQEKDSSGKSFYFKLNGVPVFIKGANYIPQNNFLPQTEKSDYRTLLKMVKGANMNMLRVWGGGVYADEEFYEDCDKAGILVWQDFMFACAMYPTDESFMGNVEKEASEQVKRLRNHPCVALWCGNNEIDEGWKNWGWQKQFNYTAADSSRIWRAYEIIFHKCLPRVVKQNAPNTPYWPSSPSIGWGHKESLQQGDSHYWGVWWGLEPFDVYTKKVGRFMSEYGFQSLPALSTFKKFCSETELDLNSEAVKNHQKHPTGFQTIIKYMEKDYIVPQDLEKFIYTSQLLQAKGMRTAIEAHRVAKPYCMGTLFWQLNDCWPVTSWSCIDYYNTPKAFYYTLKDLYNNILVSVQKKNETYAVNLVNDNNENVKGTLSVSLKDFSGKELYSKRQTITLTPNSSAMYLSITKKDLQGFDSTKTYLACHFTGNDTTVKIHSYYYFTSPKNLKLPEMKITMKYDSLSETLLVKSDKFVKDLYISCDDLIFSDNYFDLEAGEEKRINVYLSSETLKKLKFLSLNQINR